jgi:CRP-like cAMP-binding protein
MFFLAKGWTACCVHSAGGDEQIVKVHLPGDLLGSPSMTLANAAETLIALNRVTVDVVSLERFAEMFAKFPRLAAAMFLSSLQERVWLMDRLMSVGRTSAAQRLAGFLLSLHDRLLTIDPAQSNSFELPLSQREIANVLGITPVHANRVIGGLDQTGFIKRSGRLVTLLDVRALRAFSAIPERRFQGAPAWVAAVDHAARTQRASRSLPAKGQHPSRS